MLSQGNILMRVIYIYGLNNSYDEKWAQKEFDSWEDKFLTQEENSCGKNK